jgi:hypothetical protein
VGAATVSGPSAEHIDAVARLLEQSSGSDDARAVLDSSDPAVHAAMLDALTRAGVLREESIDRPVWIDTGEPIPPTHARLVGDNVPRTRHTLSFVPSRRYVTEWAEDAP